MRAKGPLSLESFNVLEYLNVTGSSTQKEIMRELELSTRSVRSSIRKLLERNLITKLPNLNDMRSVYYAISPTVSNFENMKLKEFAHIKLQHEGIFSHIKKS